jgi:signal transduction histidine kinase
VDLPGGYTWLPRYDGTQAWNVDVRNGITAGVLCLMLAAVFSLPWVGRALGVPAWVALLTVGLYGIRCLIMAPLAPRLRSRPRALEAMLVGEVLQGTLLVVAPLVVATGDPTTPLWVLAPLYASFDGADFDFPPIAAYAALHGLSPLATIPLFLASSAPSTLSVVVPVFFAGASLFAYVYTARRKVAARVAFAERDVLRERIAHERAQLDRDRVARQLTTSVLDRIERSRGAARDHRDTQIASAAREGLGELRAVLTALDAPRAETETSPVRLPVYQPVRESKLPALRLPDGWGTALIGNLCAVALPLATRDPRTAWWAASVMYASLSGSNYRAQPSVAHLLAHCGSPLLTVPLFLAQGSSVGSAIGAPMFFAALNVLSFHYCAERARVVREAQAERQQLAAQLDDARTSREFEHLGRELHDTVGSSLSLAAVYGDLLERARGDARAEARLAAGLAHAADQSIEDLRALLEGLTAHDHADLGALIGMRARRLASAVGVEVSVRANGTAGLSPTVRFALLRISQEAIANTLRHAQATRVEVVIECDQDEAQLTVSDDGDGIRPNAPEGRGVTNMRARAHELGGGLTFQAVTPRGTRVEVRLPVHGHAIAREGD